MHPAKTKQTKKKKTTITYNAEKGTPNKHFNTATREVYNYDICFSMR